MAHAAGPGADDDWALPPELAAAARLGGEMGRRVAEFDWSAHPLGSPERWPAEVRGLVATALCSRFPVVLWLGEELSVVYNDDYIPVLGNKHPEALGGAGHVVWGEVWDVIGPMLDGVVTTGVATWSDDLLLEISGSGRPEERYFTFTYSPILAGADGIAGVFCAVTETTERVIGSRRLEALNALAGTLTGAQTTQQVAEGAVAVAAGNRADLPFAAVYLAEPGDAAAALAAATPGAREALTAAAPTLAAWIGAGDAGWPGVHRVDGLRARLPVPVREAAEAPESALLLPLSDAVADSATGALLVGLSPRRSLDEEYEGFCRLFADQVSASLINARAHEVEHRRAESLAELDRAKTAFLANVSHEFRTPLTLMLGPLEDLIAESRHDPGLVQRLELVHRSGRRLQRLVNSLLDFTRIEAGQAEPQLQSVDLGALTAEIASSFSELCERAGIDLVLRCDPVTARIDAEMWETVILNLVSNAFKFTFAGAITVRVGAGADGGPEVRVSDTGAGIPPEDLPRVLDRFHRVSGHRGRGVEGSGIGLALVHDLVELHGGRVTIESEPDQGTRVHIRLPATGATDRPVAEPGEQDAAGTRAPARAAVRGGTERGENLYVTEARQWLLESAASTAGPGELARPLILVVDDNADMRRHLVSLLETRWNTVAAADGRTAIELARQIRPDLLVTDVMMPALDGLGLVEMIRRDPALEALPIIMLSARAGVEAAGEGLAAGADDYLVKPFSSRDLVNRVAARLEVAARDRAGSAHAAWLANRTAAMGELAGALGATATLADVLEVLLASDVGSVGAPAAAIGILDPDAGLVRMTYAGALDAELIDRYHVIALDAPMPMVEAISSDRAVVIHDMTELAHRFETLVRDGSESIRALTVEPLHAPTGEPVGALCFIWPDPHPLLPEELEVTEQVAAIVARAVERIRITEREHLIASELQGRLLDLEARSTAAAVSALYEPAAESMRVGGDWFTAVTLDDNKRVAVSVGDVVGHGLAGATAMSQLRSALSAVALSTGDPTVVVDHLEQYARRVPGAACATLAYALVDPESHTVEYTCAGHPYPLLLSEDGTVRYLESGRRPPLATEGVRTAHDSGSSELPPGSLLLLYTDGLLERRGESLDAGFARLADHAAPCARLPTAAACASLLRAMAPADGYLDDVALVAVRPVGETRETFVAAIPAGIEQIAGLRHRLRGWLRAGPLPLGDDGIYEVLLAAGEAVINAIEHGSGFDPRCTVSVEAFVGDGGLSISVSDSGQWRSDSAASHRDTHRGRGLTLIHSLSDGVETARTMHGTRVTMTFAQRGADEAGVR